MAGLQKFYVIWCEVNKGHWGIRKRRLKKKKSQKQERRFDTCMRGTVMSLVVSPKI